MLEGLRAGAGLRFAGLAEEGRPDFGSGGVFLSFCRADIRIAGGGRSGCGDGGHVRGWSVPYGYLESATVFNAVVAGGRDTPKGPATLLRTASHLRLGINRQSILTTSSHTTHTPTPHPPPSVPTTTKMVLRLRLARIRTPGGSKKHAPIYNIVLAQARSARDSKPMEVLGVYDPIPKTPIGAEEGQRKVKDIKVDVARAKYWLGVGAQPSDTVWRLLSMVSIP